MMLQKLSSLVFTGRPAD